MLNYDFDHPKALDFQQIEDCMREISAGNSTDIPLYSFKTNARYSFSLSQYLLTKLRYGMKTVTSSPVILLEGIHAFYHEPVRDLLDLKIFINTDDDVRLGRKCNFLMKEISK